MENNNVTNKQQYPLVSQIIVLINYIVYNNAVFFFTYVLLRQIFLIKLYNILNWPFIENTISFLMKITNTNIHQNIVTNIVTVHLCVYVYYIVCLFFYTLSIKRKTHYDYFLILMKKKFKHFNTIILYQDTIKHSYIQVQ